MAVYLGMLKYSEKGAAGVLSEGLGGRRAALEKVSEAVGGRLLAFYGTDDGEWDAVFILETGPASGNGVVTNLRGQASGTWDRIKFFHLFAPEEVDAHLGEADGFRYAGQ